MAPVVSPVVPPRRFSIAALAVMNDTATVANTGTSKTPTASTRSASVVAMLTINPRRGR